MTDVYNTIKKEAKGYFKDKGSKFHAFAFPVENEDEIKEILERVKKEHHSARHHCYAWRTGTQTIRFRANDDGEPSSTAGKPILGQLLSFDLTNVLIVVVRYFGGTLLGVGGLINAYRSAAADALNNAEIVEKILESRFVAKFTYKELNDVMLLVKQENLNVLRTQFEETCQLIFSVRNSEIQRVNQIFERLYAVELIPQND